MTRTALIFGGNGQDGIYLRRLCQEKQMRAVAVSRSSGVHPGDVGDPDYVDAVVREIEPDYVFHLAARSTTAHAAMAENHRTISTGTWNVCSAVERHVPDARVFVTGSGLQFRNDGAPISESCAFEATSPYAVERIHSVYAARYYRSRGLRTHVGYLFHHESPHRKPGHLSMRIAMGAAKVAEGRRSGLEIGDPGVEKEWGFAGDIAQGILTLVSQDEVAEATIGTGQPHAIAAWAQLCFAHVGEDWRDHVQTDPAFEPDFARLVSDPTTMRSLGWQPTTDIAELAEAMMEHVLQTRAPRSRPAARQ